MFADEWLYIGEGNVRIALANKSKNSQFFGYVLLLIKRCEGNIHPSEFVHDDTTFIEVVMKQTFTVNYISDTVEKINLCDHFLCQIMVKLALDRPIGRVTTGEGLHNNAILLRNFATIYRESPERIKLKRFNDEISFELKVKCGLKSSSPFVPNDRSVKLTVSRFQLMQCYKSVRLHSLQKQGLPWGQFTTQSMYNPAHLTSGNNVLILSTLNELIKNPQNILRISINNRHVYGWSITNHDSLFEACSCSDLVLEDPQKSSSHDFDGILSAISEIFAAEDLLKVLAQAQDLDVLDVEGAALAHKRVATLLEGSGVSANAYILHRMLMPLETELIHSLPMAHNKNSPSSIVAELRSLRVNETTPWQIRTECRSRAEDLVNSASLEQCALLLQLWMVALIAKDASVVATLKRVVMVGHEGEHSTGVKRKQTPTHCGLVTLSKSEQCDDALHYIYSLGLIDVGLKGLDKMWGKELQEDEVCAAARCIFTQT